MHEMMDFRRWVVLVILMMVVVSGLVSFSYANMVFKVHHKFAGQPRNISAFVAHDLRRHGRLLSALDLPLGGNGLLTDDGLYYARIGLGNPSNDYYVHVDTGSDILWVNCANCQQCPSKTDIGIKLTKYDPEKSSSAQKISCDDDFCQTTFNGTEPIHCNGNSQCQYSLSYGDGSSTSGFLVKDTVHLEKVTGNLQTTSTDGSIAFGCATQQKGRLAESSKVVDGILGFGQAESSMISQLASAGKVKRTFAHCLDNVHGGGIFAIGEVVSPKVNTTPMAPDQTHYNVVVKEIEVGGNVLDLPPDASQSGLDQIETIIDSGTTLTYLAESAYNSIINQVQASQPGVNFIKVEGQICFQFSEDVDRAFPVVTFRFDGPLTLTVYPHDYLIHIQGQWCIGWQNMGELSVPVELQNTNILGDMVLSNKLVVYDIENQAIGWTEHDCSSSIQVKDESSGSVYTVGAHNISSASRLIITGTTSATILLMLLFASIKSNLIVTNGASTLIFFFSFSRI